jgi:glycosyltransferase involved in cell wall biosynthesis
MRLAIVGIRGIPNSYGGFETLAEYLVEYLAGDIDITVFCSSKDQSKKQKEYKGAKLRYIPVTSHGALGIVYDSISLFLSVKKYDKILFLGFGGGFIMPLLKKHGSKIILNIGGLDWKRDKWSGRTKKIIKKAEKLLVKYCSQIIADNKGIQEYLLAEYGRSSTLIAYGGDQAERIAPSEEERRQYSFLNSGYAFVVTRIQPDNNIEMLLKAFMHQQNMPLVMVGNFDNSAYGKLIKAKYAEVQNLILLDAIYDRKKLDVLRSNCTVYIHGHSVGGTNPSLVEAMYLGLPVFAYASGYNENTTYHKAKFFRDENELTQMIENIEKIDLKQLGENMKELAEKYYRWSQIAAGYKEVILNN